LPTLDPLFSDVSEGQMALCRLMYDTLVTLDWTGEVQPLLATSWTVLDGKRTFTFSLREDARFHDDPCFADSAGRLLTSRDVKASLERVYLHIHTYEGHPLADSPRVVGTDALLAGEADHLAGIETPDDHTVVVRFDRPATEFLHTLSWLPWSITPVEALEAYAGDGDLRRNVVGTGPYRVSGEGAGADLTLLPHAAAWQRDPEGRSLPFPDRIEVHLYKGPIAAGTSLKEGRIDLLMGVPDTLRDEFFDVGNGKATPRAGREGYRAGGYLDDAMREQRVMLFDTRSENPLLADARIRRAVGLALRRDELTPEDGFPTDSALVDSMLGYKPRAHADPEQAKALLAEAGFDGSEDGPELTLCGTASFHDHMRSIQTHLAAVGIPSAVVPADPRAMHEYMTEGGCDALMLAMVGLVVDDDPLEFMISYGSMVQLDQRVEDFPAFIDRARDQGDLERRAEMSLELARILEDDAMILILAERRPGIPDYAFIATDRVGGLTDPRTDLMNPLRERLHQLWVRPEQP
jgi:peptide/nickel transport system substrate-binding protein